jgi:NADH pyrophosphatase NudC (nudix superfamily)
MTSLTRTGRAIVNYCNNAQSSPQYFVGNPLDRSCLIGNRKDPDLLATVLADGRTKCLICSQQSDRGTSKLVMCGQPSSSSLLLQLTFLTVAETLQVAGCMSTADLILFTEVVLLGRGEGGSWVISIDVSSNTTNNDNITTTVAAFSPHDQLMFSFYDARSLLHQASLKRFSEPEVALAGQVFAISGWHSTNRFHGSTGLPTVPVECGMKRSISVTSRDKVYPRTDPVAICLVISPDGESILLGHMKRGPPGFFSCLSGFVEQCESVQEAVCREVLEESGITLEVLSVRLVDSQPWPLGRGGGCELMLGCVAQATSWEINIHDQEVEEVRWFSRQEVDQLLSPTPTSSLASGSGSGSPLAPSATSEEEGGAVDAHIPGEYAIAHHLIKSFLNTGDGDGDEEDATVTISTPPRLHSHYTLFIVPILMFLFNAKISLSVNIIYK